MKTNKKDILSILLGNTLLALAVILFIVPGHLLSGGTTGISLFLIIIFIYQFHYLLLFLILLSLLLERLFWERNLLYKHLFSTFYYPFILGVFELSFQGFYLTDDILINTLFAGVLVAGVCIYVY